MPRAAPPRPRPCAHPAGVKRTERRGQPRPAATRRTDASGTARPSGRRHAGTTPPPRRSAPAQCRGRRRLSPRCRSPPLRPASRTPASPASRTPPAPATGTPPPEPSPRAGRRRDPSRSTDAGPRRSGWGIRVGDEGRAGDVDQWGGQDSNLCRQSQRVYSPSPLATRTPPRAGGLYRCSPTPRSAVPAPLAGSPASSACCSRSGGCARG